ncbi:MAG: (2Fe-2S) ferredoxin domain-containing protein [Anaerolineaceae bacterium]|nr:(2Fe-2S) ferredoxin domain-containing protein [Anaerolineaceae bacterium]
MDHPKPARPRLVLCRGQYCNISSRSDHLYEYLQTLVEDAVGDQRPRPIKLEIANCLDHCGIAPVLILYPSSEIFGELTEDQLEDIVNKAMKAAVPQSDSGAGQ